MISLSALTAAIHLLSVSWHPWLVIIPGLLIGLAVHAVPGLTTSMALAICLPLIPYMDFLQALIFMTAMYGGALFGVAIPAILLNVPGSAAAVGTTFDGFPMAQAGRHNEALGIALASSCFGQGVAYLLLLCLAGPIGAFAIRLGPPEMLVVSLLGLMLIARLRGRHLARGLLAGLFGLLLGVVGLNAYGTSRGTMGFDLLLDGVPLVPAIVGLFAAAELFNLVGRDYIVDDRSLRRVSARRILAGMRDTFRYPGTLLRGALLGSGIGILPGGHAIANLLSYSEARRTARDPEKFGTGDPRGIIAAESANASSEGGSMATLLALGIPTGGATAVMLVAFSMHNITGGPAFMRDHADLVYAVILSSLAQVLMLAVLGFGFIFIAGFVVKVRLRALVPLVLATAVIGSFALAQNIAGPITLALFAVIGWLMQRFDYPVAAAVVGLLLGRLTEGSLLRTWQMSGGDIGFLFTRPIAIGMVAVLIAALVLPRVTARRSRAPRTRKGDHTTMKRRHFLATAAAAAVATPALADDYPRRPLTIVVPFDVGGSADRMARGFTQFMPKYLGQPMTVVDRVGAGGMVGTSWLLQQPADGYTVMFTPATPFIPVNILVTHARYTLDSFTFVNAQWTDYTILMVPKDRPWKTAAELIDAIKAKPGTISTGVDFGAVGDITTLALLDALGLPREALRIVTFPGAGAMRTALAGGQVDFSISQAEGANFIGDFVRPLAVFLDHKTPEYDVPLINDVLKKYNTKVPIISGSVRSFVFPAAFKAKHPEDYAKFVTAYRKTLDDPDFQKWLHDHQMVGEWVGEARTEEIIRTNFEALKKYKDLMTQ